MEKDKFIISGSFTNGTFQEYSSVEIMFFAPKDMKFYDTFFAITLVRSSNKVAVRYIPLKKSEVIKFMISIFKRCLK